MVNVVFITHFIVTFFSLAVAIVLQVVHFPLLRYIGPYQYPVYYKQQKMKLTLLTFPIYSLEGFTAVLLTVSFFSIGKLTPERQNSFFVYLSSVIVLLIIHLITFYAIKPLLKKLLNVWEERVLKELKMWNLIRTLLWLTRAIILIVIVVR